MIIWIIDKKTMLSSRILDPGIALTLLILLAPLFLVIAVAIKFDSPGPVFYRHLRVGQGGKPFRQLKFRTMTSCPTTTPLRPLPGRDDSELPSADELLRRLPPDPRVTRFGRVLRRTPLDELPVLLNVLKGEMSLVGLSASG
ncbi:MAG: sugar transferase [Planctomycetota bacterium]|jgi:lipopolysaccharide/colanic/teichoic acid biosynthesis glycosyltransferase